MLNLHRVRQPQYFDRFRCIAADCEDTCCNGWEILVDRGTYEKYQNAPARQIADKALSSLVEINPARSSESDYAKFRLEPAGCPALHQGLCSVHGTLGESYIPDLCSTYPRVLTAIGGAVERSLHLSCPEAARIVLSDPDAMVIHERVEEGLPHRSGSVKLIAGDPEDRMYQVRSLVIQVIRERSLPLWQRIVSLGFAMEKLADVDTARAVEVLEDHLSQLRQGSFREALARQEGDAAFQLETVLELVVIRIESDYTAPRFIECYRDFMRGLAWRPDAPTEELAARRSMASRSYLLPFLSRNEHLLENYLINYIFRTIFPYRRKLPDQKFALDSSRESLRNALLLLSIHYTIVRTLLIGMAALYKDKLTMDHAIKLVQSYSKAFLHVSSFENLAVEYLEKAVEDPAGKIAALVMD